MKDWDGKAEPFQIHDTGWTVIFLVVLLTGAGLLIHFN
jgi:hypothetical protein